MQRKNSSYTRQAWSVLLENALDRPDAPYINPGKYYHFILRFQVGENTHVQKWYLLQALTDVLGILNGTDSDQQ